MGIGEAREAGAIALFGEKYGDVVRTVSVGEISMELCGGTHCTNTGEIGAFHILHESSVAAGIRRIEAVAGRSAIQYFRQVESSLSDVAASLNCKPGEVAERVGALHDRIKSLQDEVKAAREMSASTNLDDLLASAQEVNGALLVTASVPNADHDALSALADKITDKLSDAVAVLGSAQGDKVNLVCKVTPALLERGAHAGNLIKAVAQACDGGGGGRPNFAKAGGKDPAKLDDALAQAAAALEEQLS